MARPSKVLSVVGTRPNFMKIAPIAAELRRRGDDYDHVLVHTGQHYDDVLSRIFIEELGMPEPDHYLSVGSGPHAQQVARVMERLDPVLEELSPDIVLVPGDVNSTVAAALAAVQRRIPVGHVEAGLRSFDRSMPEEVNRVVTDAVSELLFTHSPEAREHLLAEGRPADSIHEVGNTMIDTLVAMRDRVEAAAVAESHGLQPLGYVVVTLHRPALVDGPLLRDALRGLEAISEELTVIFPAHPRTLASMKRQGLVPAGDVRLIDPLGYVDFLSLLASAAGTLTDSGGIQEEATFLGIPCFTLRANTERPVTIEHGTNVLLGLSPERIVEVPALIRQARSRSASVPELWDGEASRRIVDVLDRMRAGDLSRA